MILDARWFQFKMESDVTPSKPNDMELLMHHNLCKWLTFRGIDVKRGVGHETSIVGTLTGTGSPPPPSSTSTVPSSLKAVGLRADMDALPMTEENDFEHKSTISGKMHGCGHDGHTTMLLGAAKYLSENRSKFYGNVHFIFQLYISTCRRRW